jgi:DNA-binding transcriptional ArsR family regulator
MVRGARVADEAVRAYLEALQDPNTAVDWDEVEELASQIAAATDPVNRVMLRAEWRRASDPSTYLPDLEADFIAFADQWSQANRVSADDFFYEGVPLQVLREAGMGISEEARAYAESDEGEVLSTAVTSSRQVPADDDDEPAPAPVSLFEPGSAMDKVHAAIGSEPFTINDLVDRADASRSTVRAVLDKLEEAGHLAELPPQDTGTSGRSPKRYQLTRR